MADIKAGVLLSLKDQFSQGIKGAGASVQSFSQQAVGAANKINDAFSSVAGTLGTLGVSLGALATVKATIDMDDRLTRLGLTADASAAQVNELKRQIFEAAQLPHIKLDPSEIVSALEVVMTKTGDLEYVSKNIENIAVAIKATGEEGSSIGSVFSEFQKFSYSAKDIAALMDDMVKQGDMGAFTFGEFAKAGSAVISAYSNIGTSTDNLRQANAAMQIIMMGTKSAEIAVTALNSTMAELSDPKRQEELRKIGINVRDSVTGEFRDLNDIMKDLVLKAEEVGNTDFLGTIFGTTSMQAIRAYSNFGYLHEKLTDLGDTTGAMLGKSATMAGTMASNLQNLQTAWLAFGDERLAKPLEKLTGFLNYMAEHPKIATTAMWGLTAAVGALGAVKIGAGIVSLIANLKGIKGGKIDLAGAAGGGAGIPVHITNWGGYQGASPLSGNPLANMPKGLAAGGGIPAGGYIALGGATAAALYAGAHVAHSYRAPTDPAVPGMSNYYNMHWGARRKAWAQYEAEHPDEMTYDQRVAAVRREIPAGIGEEIGSVPAIPQGGGNPVLEGTAQLENHVYIHQDRYEVESFVKNNNTPIAFPTGSAQEARSAVL
jgi:hypothetical protein